jgi:polyphenol oxidase
MSWIEPEWLHPAGVRALCTLREGGVSNADFATLNLGDHVGDTREAVASNRRQLRSEAGLPSEPNWLQQIHGVAVADLDSLQRRVAGQPVADASVTCEPDVVCAILTADCLPVLLAAADGSAVAAAHAGWRGLAAGVLEATVGVLRKQVGPEPLLAWLGPAIGPEYFEVGEEVRAAFLRHDMRADSAFALNDAGRWQCDLYALARQRLQALGITAISGGGFCTYADEGRFYSHRRDVQHKGRRSTGRMATLIWKQGT